MIIASILIIIMGFVSLFKPHVIWKIQHSLDVKNGEPTDGYLIFIRCVGVFAIVVGIIFLIVNVI